MTVALLTLLAIGLGPPTGAYQVRTVLTGSMRPTMPEGSVMMIMPVRPSQVRVDDVITYRIPVDDRRIVTHRVVEIVEPGPEPVVRTKGDANNAPDPWVARLRGDQAWRARLSVPKVGYVLATLRHPASRWLTVLGAPALLAVVSVVRIWASPKADDPLRAENDHAPDRPPSLRERPEKPPRQPPPREVTDQERWQGWRERRALQRPVKRGLDDPGRAEADHALDRPPPGEGSDKRRGHPAPREPTEQNEWQGWRERRALQRPVTRGLDDPRRAEADHALDRPPPGEGSKKRRRQPAPREPTEQERWQEWRERRALQRPVKRGLDA